MPGRASTGNSDKCVIEAAPHEPSAAAFLTTLDSHGAAGLGMAAQDPFAGRGLVVLAMTRTGLSFVFGLMLDPVCPTEA